MNKNLNKVIAVLLTAAMLLPNFSPFTLNGAEPSGDDPGTVVSKGAFDLRAYNTPGHSSGNLNVEWDSQGSDWLYRYYQRLAGETQWQERSTKYGKPITVLNIMANEIPYLERWMAAFKEEATAKGANIEVTSVTQTNFNNAPDTYLKGGGDSYKYDVVVIGFADLNGGSGQTRSRTNAVAALEDYIKAGGGVLFGHDSLFDAEPLNDTNLTALPSGAGNNRWQYSDTKPTLNADTAQWYNDHGGNENVWLSGTWGYSKLAKYIGVIPGVDKTGTSWTSRFGGQAYKNSAGNLVNGYTPSYMEYHIGDAGTTIYKNAQEASFVKVTNDGFLTTYPNELPYGTVLTVPRSHVNGSAAAGTEWMTYVSNLAGEAFPESDQHGRAFNRHYYEYDGVVYTDMGYLVSNKNTALIQTGHRDGWVTRDEIAIIVNTMYHLAQLTADTSLEDSSALDQAPPDGPSARLSGHNADNSININVHADDNGTAYEVMAEALQQKDPFATSKSDVVSQISMTGTKGYLYLISDKDAGQITLDDIAVSNGVGGFEPDPAPGAVSLEHLPGEGAEVTLETVANQGKYIHFVAFDYAENLSEIKSYAIDDFKPAINIQVVDEEGLPVSLAEIIALGENHTTDVNGLLTIYPPGTGEYTIAAHAAGFNMESVTVTIAPEQLETEAKIVLRPLSSGSIYGFVRDTANTPIPGALVRTLTEGDGTTDDFGFYVINGLSAGSHTVVASKDGFNSEFDTVHILDTLVPVQKDFTLTARDGINNRYILTGIVSDADTGFGLTGASITLAGTSQQVKTDNFGGYAMGYFEKGSQFFDYENPGYIPNLNEAILFTDNDQEHNVALEFLDGAGRVVVRIKNEGGQLLSGARAMLGGLERTAGATGEAFFNLNYGNYSLLVQAQGYNAYTQQVSVNKEYTLVEVTLTPGSKGGLYGRIIDGQTQEGIPGGTVETVNPAGGKTLSDNAGYYVLAPLDLGVYAVVAHQQGYMPGTANLSVIESGANTHDFYLTPAAENNYYIFGRVYNEGNENQGVAGANVEDDGQVPKSALTDNEGYYALTGYSSGTAVHISASRGSVKSAAELVQIQTAPVRQDLYLRNQLTIVVQYLEEGTEAELFSYSIPTSRSAEAFDITANAYPDYKLITNPDTVRIDPASVAVDEFSQHTVKFYYRYDMADVTIQAYIAGGSIPVPAFTPFTVKARIDSPFIYDGDIEIPGYTFASRGAEIVVSGGQANIYPLYYYEATGDMIIRAVDIDTGRTMGSFQQKLNLNQEYVIHQDNSPDPGRIPELQYYTLELESSYIGQQGTTSYTYTGMGEAIPDAVYLFRQKTTPVAIQLLFADDNSVLAAATIDAPQGEYFTYTLSQAQDLLSAQRPNATDYAFITQSDQQVFVKEEGATPKIQFYLKSNLAQITLDIHYKYYDENGIGKLITSTQITGVEGEVKTIEAADIKGWLLAEGQEVEQTVTLAKSMPPVAFYYVLDTITITIHGEDGDGKPIALPSGSNTVKAPRDVPYTLFAPGVTGYRAIGYNYDGTANAGVVIPFTAQDMADDKTVTFIYTPETLEDYSVSVLVTGKIDDQILYSYTAVYPKGSGDQLINAFPLKGYQVLGADSAVITAGETATPSSVDFIYTDLDTYVTIELLNLDNGETRTITEKAVLEQPFSYNAPYVAQWYLRDTETIQTIDAVQQGSSLTFRYGSIPKAGVQVMAKEVDGSGEVVKEIKTALANTEGWSSGSTQTINVTELLNLENAPNYYVYGPSPADPSGTGTITFTYDALLGNSFVVYYTKELVEVSIEAVDTNAQIINSYFVSQRKGEVFLAQAPEVDLALYASAGPLSKNVAALADTPIQFLFNRLGQGTIGVIAKDQNNGQNVLLSYSVVGVIDQTLDIPSPDLTRQGWALAQGQPSAQTVKVSSQNEAVAFLYEDIRYELNLYTKVKDQTETVPYAKERHPAGNTVPVYGPYKNGHILYGYQIDDGETQLVSQDFTGLSLEISKNTDVTFIYQPISEIIGGHTIQINISGVDAKSGRTLYSYQRTAAQSSGDIAIEAFQQSGYDLISESPKIITVGEENVAVVFQYQSLETSVSVEMKDEEGNAVAQSYRLNGEAGKAMTVYGPDVPGYSLVTDLPKLIVPEIDSEKNIVTFVYRKITGRVTLTALEEMAGEDYFIRVFEIEESLLNIGTDTEIDVPEIDSYDRTAGKVTIHWDGVSSVDATVYYTRQTAEVTLYFMDFATDLEIAPHQTYTARLKEGQTYGAPHITGYHLVSGPTAAIVPEKGGENKIVFRYRNLAEGEVSVKLIAESTGLTIDSYTVNSKAGEELKLKAPAKQGWILTSPDTAVVIAGSDKEAIFYYKEDFVTLSLLFETEDQLVLGTEEILLLRGQSYTARAPHIPGYVISGQSEKVFTSIIKDENETFVYKHISTEVPNHTVSVQIRGLDQDTNQELYSYSMQQPKNYGQLTLEAMAVSGFDITGSGLETVNVLESDITVTFYYASIKRIITIHGVTEDGSTIENFTPIMVQANRGQPFAYNAPFITGYNYVGYEAASGELNSSVIQSINEVADDMDLYFQYEKSEGNILITLREDGPEGRIIKTLSDTLAMGESKNIPIPDLKDSYYQPLSSQEEVVENTDNTLAYVTYYYAKEVRDVNLAAVDMDNGNAVLAVKQAGSYRLGEGATFMAFYHENLEGYRLIGDSEITVIMEPGEDSYIVPFLYKPISQREVLILAIEEDTGEILGSSLIKAAAGSVARANAMTIAGYNLAQGEPSYKDVAAPGTAIFKYTRDAVKVTLDLRDDKDNIIEVSSHIQREFVYTRGQYIKVFAPHIPGYVIKNNTSSVAAFTPITGDETVTFVYAPIEEIIGDYQITIHILGEDMDSMELYQDTIKVPKNSGETSVFGQYVWGYSLQQILVDGVVQDFSAVQDTEILVYAGTADITVVFRYRSLLTQVAIILEDGDTGEILDKFYADAIEGEAFTYRAPHVNGYYLVNPSTIGRIDAVAGDGSSQLVFTYRRITASIVLVATEPGNDSIIRLVEVDNNGWEEGSYFIKTPDLTNDYFTYTGNEFDPNDTTGYIELYYVPGDTGFIEVYYDKDVADVDVVAREKTHSGKILLQNDEFARKGESVTVYAPHLEDYNLISSEIYVLVPTDNVEITFLYTAFGNGGGNGGGDGGSGGGNGGGDGGSGGNGGGSTGGGGSNGGNGGNTGSASNYTASLIVMGVDHKNEELYRDTSRHKVGDVVTVNARNLEGYELNDATPKSITITASNSKNVITFKYGVVMENEGISIAPSTHKAYISGYEDGSFRPMNNITRGEAAMIFYKLTEDAAKYLPQNNPYTDVQGDEWYAQAVLYLTNKNILRGDGNGLFRAGSNITRAEMAILCSQFFTMNTGAQHPFTDVPNNHFAGKYIANAYSKGWIFGYGDNTFKPDAQILRGETVSMVNRIYDRMIHKEDLPAYVRTFHDVQPSFWAYDTIMEAANDHVYTRRDDGYELWQ